MTIEKIMEMMDKFEDQIRNAERSVPYEEANDHNAYAVRIRIKIIKAIKKYKEQK